MTASAAIPLLFRILLLYFEPLFAFAGAVLVLTKPEAYVSQTSRNLMSAIDPHSHFIYTQLAGGWLHFAFTEAVVLRLVDDVRVWRLLCMGMLLSDLAYCHSVAQGIGGWTVWLNVFAWTKDDWMVTLTTWPFVITRLAIASGLGIRAPGSRQKKSKQ